MLRHPGRRNSRGSDEYRNFRRAVLKRDGYRCQMPGCKKRYRLQVHHIVRYADCYRGRLNPLNGITLCRSCHDSIKDFEGRWVKLFLKIAIENDSKKK